MNSKRECGHAIFTSTQTVLAHAILSSYQKFRNEIATSMRTLTKKTILKYIKARFRPFSISLTLDLYWKRKKKWSELSTQRIYNDWNRNSRDRALSCGLLQSEQFEQSFYNFKTQRIYIHWICDVRENVNEFELAAWLVLLYK